MKATINYACACSAMILISTQLSRSVLFAGETNAHSNNQQVEERHFYTGMRFDYIQYVIHSDGTDKARLQKVVEYDWTSGTWKWWILSDDGTQVVELIIIRQDAKLGQINLRKKLRPDGSVASEQIEIKSTGQSSAKTFAGNEGGFEKPRSELLELTPDWGWSKVKAPIEVTQGKYTAKSGETVNAYSGVEVSAEKGSKVNAYGALVRAHEGSEVTVYKGAFVFIEPGAWIQYTYEAPLPVGNRPFLLYMNGSFTFCKANSEVTIPARTWFKVYDVPERQR